MGKSAAANSERIGAETKRVVDIYLDVATAIVPDLSSVAALPKIAAHAMMEIRSAWVDSILIGARTSQELLRQATEQQQRFAADVAEGWMEQNKRVMQIIMRAVQEGVWPVASRRTHSEEQHWSGR
jgi:hypothetical protein